MKDLERQFDAILRDFTNTSYGFNETIKRLVDTVEGYFKETGKQGGMTRKNQKPDYSALGKKRSAKRWKNLNFPCNPIVHRLLSNQRALLLTD